MTEEEFLEDIEKTLKKIKESAFNFKAFSAAHSRKINRIFIKGLMKSGGGIKKIGNYTSDAYIQLRKKKNRQTGFVNLVFTRRLRINHSNSLQREGREWISGVSAENEGKKEGMEERYGSELFFHTNKEIAQIGRDSLI